MPNSPLGLPEVRLNDGASGSRARLGTWHMGERRGPRGRRGAVLRMGLDLGMTLIDTAEMYGDGGAERVVGDAIAADRDGVFVVSKVYPHNASAKGTITACDRSLARLAHRIASISICCTGAAAIRSPKRSMHSSACAPRARSCAGACRTSTSPTWTSFVAARWKSLRCNQVLYNLSQRGVEFELRERCARNDVVIMAYSPFQQGDLLPQPKIGNSCRVARHDTRAARDRLAACAKRHHRHSAIVERRPRARVSAQPPTFACRTEAMKMIDAAFAPPRSARPARDAVDAAHRRYCRSRRTVVYKLRAATTFIGCKSARSGVVARLVLNAGHRERNRSTRNLEGEVR
jgi:diketogulonate reductase-like aldo/keto reductase